MKPWNLPGALLRRLGIAAKAATKLSGDSAKLQKWMRSPQPHASRTIIDLAVQPPMLKADDAEAENRPAAPDPGVKLFKIRLADNEGRRRSASILLQRRYAWRGYNVSSAPIAEPHRITLSAFDGDHAIATISVCLDSPQGLFVEALFRDEVNSLRAQEKRVCEFTKLAIDESLKSKPVLASIFHIAYIYARRINCHTDLVVEVNPRHVKFYERMLGFCALGPVRDDPRVQAPAALLHLDLGHAEAQIAKFGGKAQLGATVRSLYPFFFSPHEEAGIETRLRAAG
jgi:hypothetical protein